MWVQAAEDAIMAEMAEVKAGMERRQKREKRKKLEQKKKARVRAAQAVLGLSSAETPCFCDSCMQALTCLSPSCL